MADDGSSRVTEVQYDLGPASGTDSMRYSLDRGLSFTNLCLGYKGGVEIGLVNPSLRNCLRCIHQALSVRLPLVRI